MATYRIIFSKEYQRIVPALMIDTREGTALANQIGTVIKSYTDAAVNAITDNTLFYKLETMQGVLSGYFTLEINKETNTVNVASMILRHAFKTDILNIENQVNSFIQSSNWRQDYL